MDRLIAALAYIFVSAVFLLLLVMSNAALFFPAVFICAYLPVCAECLVHHEDQRVRNSVRFAESPDEIVI